MLKKIKTLRTRLLPGFTKPLGSVLAIAAAAVALITLPLVHADNYQAQINSLNSQNSQVESVLSGLQSTATSYQSVIDSLQAQISAIQTSIDSNQASEAADTAKITADEAQITQNKQILADDIKTMYLNGQMTTIEELATSKNLSDYVDAQEYRTLIQDKITSLLQTVQTLEAQTEVQKQQIAALVVTEQAQQNQVSADQAQENQLLSANQSQQAQYNQEISANNSEINQLRAEQAAADASIAKSVRVSASPSDGSGGACDIGSGNGGYPAVWCDAAQDSLTDSGGFPNRECTSFAYWYFTAIEHQSGFSVNGNAGWWWETSNFPVSTYPNVKPGAIGVEPSSSLDAPVPSLHGGYYGHVMIVLADGGSNGTTYNGAFPYTAAASGTYVPAGDELVMSMNEDEEGHFMYNLWPANYLMYINPQ